MISCRYGSHLGPRPALHLHQTRLAASPLPESPAVQWVEPSHSRSACLSIHCPSLFKKCEMCACVLCMSGWGWGVVSMLILLTSRRNTLPAPSVSTHTPLPCRLDLTAGGDDGENLGSRRGVDPEESERQREAERRPEPAATGGCPDSPSHPIWYSEVSLMLQLLRGGKGSLRQLYLICFKTKLYASFDRRQNV